MDRKVEALKPFYPEIGTLTPDPIVMQMEIDEAAKLAEIMAK